MNGRARVAAWTALGLGFLLHAAAWAGEKVGDIEVAVLPLPNRASSSSYGTGLGTTHGYIEYRVQLKNSSSQERIVHLSYPGDRYGRVDYGVVTSRTVHVAGGQEVFVSLYQPPLVVAGQVLDVRVEGVRESLPIPVTSLFGGQSSGYSPYYGNSLASSRPQAAVLLSRSFPQDFGGRGQPSAGGSGVWSARAAMPATSPQLGGFAFLRSELPVSQWSANWLGYSCYDVILVTQREVEQMPAQVQLAIRRYVECGGTLLVHGRNVPPVFSQGGLADEKEGYFVGLGYAGGSPLDGESDWDATFRKLEAVPVHVYQPQFTPRDFAELLVKEAAIPMRGLFVLVLLFAVAMGPLNVWLLSRYKRRIWLWWDVPAISVLTCLAVFCYASFSEGWAGRGKVASLTLLDERCHRATTVGFLSYYCPLTPSVGPRFSVDSDVAQIASDRNSARSEAGLRFVDWTSDQQLTSGWISARVPTYFQIRKNEDRRERLTAQKRADGSLAIVNALGADIRQLYWVDPSGRLFEVQDVAAGAQKALVPTHEPVIAPQGAQLFLRNGLAGFDWVGLLVRWRQRGRDAAACLKPGSYVAFLDKSPFVEAPLEGVRSEDTVAVVYGICKEADDGR